MFDPGNEFGYGLSPYQSQEAFEAFEERDDRDDFLEGFTRFVALLTMGILLTLVIRWIPALRPFYWLGIGGLIFYLCLGSYLDRNVKLLSLAVASFLAIALGHWDFLNHTTQQAAQAGQQMIQQVKERLP
jgi:hypothetical protein